MARKCLHLKDNPIVVCVSTNMIKKEKKQWRIMLFGIEKFCGWNGFFSRFVFPLGKKDCAAAWYKMGRIQKKKMVEFLKLLT